MYLFIVFIFFLLVDLCIKGDEVVPSVRYIAIFFLLNWYVIPLYINTPLRAESSLGVNVDKNEIKKNVRTVSCTHARR